jgi:hypothetical protein
MRQIKDTLSRHQDDWSRQEFALLGAFAAGCMIFVFSFAYLLGFGHSDQQTADARIIPPAAIGERIPVFPTPR